ncbi:MAG: DUF4126 domain-containing protein [Kineosporiaceae bacterium]
MSVLPWVVSSGWASGVNSYAMVLFLGIAGRFLGADDVPPALERTDVMLVALVLFALEAVVDKIPYLDSVWDTVHTVVRPGISAAVSALMAGQVGDLDGAAQVGLSALGGATALASHLVKASLRVAVNTSPEPVSNIAVSAGEDVGVAAVIGLAVLHPWVAASVALALLVLGTVLVVSLWRLVRRGFRQRRARRSRQAAAAGAA